MYTQKNIFILTLRLCNITNIFHLFNKVVKGVCKNPVLGVEHASSVDLDNNTTLLLTPVTFQVSSILPQS